MEKYRLQSVLQLSNDGGGRFLDKIDCVEMCADMESAENLLQVKISKKLSHYSRMGLNWKILEKKIRLDTPDDEGFLRKGFDVKF